MKKFWALLLAVMLVVGMVAGCGGGAAEEPAPEAPAGDEPPAEEPAEPYKVALLLPGAINDAGFNQLGYEGLMAAKDKYGLDVAYTEQIPQVDFETVLYDYIDKGYDLILGNGFDFTDAMLKIAPTAPEVQFAIINGNEALAPNLAVYRFYTPETGFIAGAAAALVSESGKVGMIGGQSFPHIVDAAVGFEAGAKYINPDIQVLTGYTESWTDVAKGKEMAMAMIDQGVDVVVGNANQVTLGIIGAAQERGVRAIGYIDDQSAVAPETVAISSIQSVSELMDTMIQDAMNGEMEPVKNLVGVKEGVVRPTDWNHPEWVDEEGMAKWEEVVTGLQDGSFKSSGVIPKSSFED